MEAKNPDFRRRLKEAEAEFDALIRQLTEEAKGKAAHEQTWPWGIQSFAPWSGVDVKVAKWFFMASRGLLVDGRLQEKVAE